MDETYVGGYPEFKKMYKNRQLHKMLKPVLDPISGTLYLVDLSF